jgi:hypothetical protein
VRLPSLADRGRGLDRGTHGRMGEQDATARDADQAGPLGPAQLLRHRCARAEQDVELVDIGEGGEQQQTAHRSRQGGHAIAEQRREARPERLPGPQRQLLQREGAAFRLVQHPPAIRSAQPRRPGGQQGGRGLLTHRGQPVFREATADAGRPGRGQQPDATPRQVSGERTQALRARQVHHRQVVDADHDGPGARRSLQGGDQGRDHSDAIDRVPVAPVLAEYGRQHRAVTGVEPLHRPPSGASNWLSPANGRSASSWTPSARTTNAPAAAAIAAAASSKAVLPIPAGPVTSRAALSTAAPARNRRMISISLSRPSRATSEDISGPARRIGPRRGGNLAAAPKSCRAVSNARRGRASVE